MELEPVSTAIVLRFTANWVMILSKSAGFVTDGHVEIKTAILWSLNAQSIFMGK